MAARWKNLRFLSMPIRQADHCTCRKFGAKFNTLGDAEEIFLDFGLLKLIQQKFPKLW